MKKLKLTIAGEVKIFDLPKNGEYKCEVEECYVPKVGDCVKVECIEPNNTYFYWLKVKEVVSARVEFSWAVEENFQISKNGFLNISSNRIYTQITPEELKAKYAEAGYDWDYESDTIKPIKWSPKDGDIVWYLTSSLSVIGVSYNNGYSYLLDKGLLFKTEEECQKFVDHCMKYINKKE